MTAGGEHFLRGQSLHGRLEELAAQRPDEPALIEGARILTWSEFDHAAATLAGGLTGLGLQDGDVLACQLPSSIEFLVLHVATAKAGIILNAIHPAYRSHEIDYMLRFGGAKAMVVPGSGSFDYVGMVRKLDIRNLEVLTSDHLPNGDPLSVAVEPSHPFILLFTSGTESSPKAVLHTHDALLSNGYHLGRELGIRQEDAVLCTAPLSHLFGLCSFYVALGAGARVVVYPNFDERSLVDAVAQHRVAAVFAPPPHLMALVQIEEPPPLPNFRIALSSGSSCPRWLRETLQLKYHCVPVDQWGMTECQAGIFNRPSDFGEKLMSTSGRPAPGVRVRTVDDAGNDVGSGAVGQLLYQGPYLFDGYLRRPDLTAESWTEDGWFVTGDLASIDAEGYVRIEGRTKDVINRGGLKVNPIEIEELLLTHPNVRQVAIVPMPDPRLGERSCAYVSLREGAADVTLADVTDFLLARGVAKYKLPERLEVWPELPTTATRKIQKAVLRKAIQDP